MSTSWRLNCEYLMTIMQVSEIGNVLMSTSTSHFLNVFDVFNVFHMLFVDGIF